MEIILHPVCDNLFRALQSQIDSVHIHVWSIQLLYRPSLRHDSRRQQTPFLGSPLQFYLLDEERTGLRKITPGYVALCRICFPRGFKLLRVTFRLHLFFSSSNLTTSACKYLRHAKKQIVFANKQQTQNVNFCRLIFYVTPKILRGNLQLGLGNWSSCAKVVNYIFHTCFSYFYHHVENKLVYASGSTSSPLILSHINWLTLIYAD